MSVALPVAAVVFGSVTPPQGDILDLIVHLGATEEVSSFSCLLQNFDKKYSPAGTYPIVIGSDGSISLGRNPNQPLLITLRVEKILATSGYEESGEPVAALAVSGRCWGEKIFRKLVTKTFENQKGEDVVKDLIDNYVGLNHVRNSTELIEDTDTTYTLLEYENTPVFDILKFIASTSDKSGIMGFDFRVAPDGKFEFFPRNSKTSSVSLSERLEVSVYERSIFRKRDKITIYGAAEKPNVSSKDFGTDMVTPYRGSTVDQQSGSGQKNLYVASTTDFSVNDKIWIYDYPNCEENEVESIVAGDHLVCKNNLANTYAVNTQVIVYSGWGATTAGTTITADAANKVIGSRSVKVSVNDGGGWGGAVYHFSPRINMNLYPTLANFLRSSVETSGFIRLGNVDFKLASRTFQNIPDDSEFHFIEVEGGKKNEDGWKTDSGFDWTQISDVEVGMQAGVLDYWIDGLFFNRRRWEATQENTASQSSYGLRELVEVDEELHSDNECSLRAKALLAHLKDPAEYITVRSTVIDYGTNRLLPGDKIHVTLPNENIDADYRIISVEYHVIAATQTLEITLELGKEAPLLADYLYKLRSKSSSLARYKRGFR